MFNKLRNILTREFQALFQFRKTERPWYIPVLAALCTGLPLFLGYMIDRPDYGSLACLGGLVILYLPNTALDHRMATLALCSFGFVLSMGVGLVLGFHPYLSAVLVGVYAVLVNWLVNYAQLNPPGNFFFIMIASMASCMSFDVQAVPVRVGLIAMGTIFACIFALLFSLYLLRIRNKPVTVKVGVAPKRSYANLSESIIFGIFIMLSLIVGHLFKLHNPYWIPISCLAIMQGMNAAHVGQRSFHRMLGTFIGMGLSWLLLKFHLQPLAMVFCILFLQFIVEVLIVRHYALAVVFITPMTLFLAELGQGNRLEADLLIRTRLLDIVIGSLIGAVGGWLLHSRQVQQKTQRQIRKTRVAMLRR